MKKFHFQVLKMDPPPALPSYDLIKNRICNSSQLTNIIKHFICKNIIDLGPSGPTLPCLSLGYVLNLFSVATLFNYVLRHASEGMFVNFALLNSPQRMFY